DNKLALNAERDDELLKLELGELKFGGEVGDLDARHLGQAELARRQHAAVAGDNAVLAVDQYRVGEPKLADAAGDLRDLGVAVGPRVARVRDQRLDRVQHDLIGHLDGAALFKGRENG